MRRLGWTLVAFVLCLSAASAQKAKAPPAPKGPAACTCENIGTLQQELALALALMDKHAAKARDLKEKYGEDPKEEQLSAARRDYERFEAPPRAGEKPAPGSARDGLPPASAGAPGEIAYVPRGRKLFAAHANDDRQNPDNLKGIPDAIQYTADGRPQPDLARRKAIEDKFRKAGQDLCGHADEAAVKKATEAGGVCAGLSQSLATHEAVHQKTCTTMGYYAFSERKPAQLAEDEVRAYKAQVDALAGEIRRVLAKKNVKLESGTPTADPRSLTGLKIRCVLALSVAGQIDDLKLFGQVCDTAQPFEIKTAPNANFRLTPESEKSGSYAYSGNAGGAHFFGSGRYTITIGEGAGTLVLDGSGRWNVRHPLGLANKGGPETLKVNKLPDGCA